MKTTTNLAEAIARVECGLGGRNEAELIRARLHGLVFELGYNEDESWFQCRFCHRIEGEGHSECCPAQEVA